MVSRFTSPDEAWDTYVGGFGPVRAVAAGLQGQALAEMERTFLDWMGQFRTSLGLALPIDYLVTVAKRI